MNLRIAVSRLAVANAFIAFLWLIVPWTTPGTPIWQWRFISLTSSGLNLALLVTLKANALICLFLAFVAPLPVSVLAQAMGQLKCPPRLVWLFLLMDRNIHFLRQEWQHMSQAARLRGFYPRNSLHTYRTIASMLAFLLVRASNRGQRMLDAMRLRGFSGQLPYPAPKPVAAGNYVFVAFAFLFLVLICYLEIAYA